MRVAIFEPNSSGHRFAYAGRLIRGLIDLPCEVTLVTTKSAAESEQHAVHLEPLEGAFRLSPVLEEPVEEHQLLRAMTNRFFQLVRSDDFDHVYTPYADAVVSGSSRNAVGNLFRSRPAKEIELLSMRGGYVYPGESLSQRLRGAAFKAFYRYGPWSRVHHIDPRAIQRLGVDPTAESNNRFRLLPDPVETPSRLTKPEARRILGLPVDGRYAGLLGAIDRRKGGDLLIEAFVRSADALGETTRLLLAGRMERHPSVYQRVTEHPLTKAGRIRVLDRYLSNAELDAATHALDVVCTPYPDFKYPASIVTIAAAAGRPVVGTAIGWMGRTIEQFGLGVTVPPGDAQALGAALRKTLETAPDYELSAPASRFVAYHSVDNFIAHLTARIRERLGLQPHPGFRAWSGVVEAAPRRDGRTPPAL